MTDHEKNTELIKKTAAALGFDYCGIAQAKPLDEDARRLESWLQNGFHGTMQYMENHFDLRIDPGKLVPGAQSVITLLKNYFPNSVQSADSPRISKYAFGQDYHQVIRAQLRQFLEMLKLEIGDFHGRGFVDSAPVLERSWAQRSGVGWIGKNGNLINKQTGFRLRLIPFHFERLRAESRKTFRKLSSVIASHSAVDKFRISGIGVKPVS